MRNTIKGFYYECNSRFNGTPLVVLFTGFAKRTANQKTGDQIQTWILDPRDTPLNISRQNKDKSNCGDCPQRHSKGGGCYVVLMHGPAQVYKGYKNGSYTKLDLTNPVHIRHFKNRIIRLGAYGDPCAIPLSFWNDLLEKTGITKWTGFTHAWKKRENQEYKSLLMASADNLYAANLAQKKGWRYFRVRSSEDALVAKEFECPGSKEQDYRLSCAECLSCYGTKNNLKTLAANPVIISHGAKHRSFVA
mgnify:CR=1 FL=1